MNMKYAKKMRNIENTISQESLKSIIVGDQKVGFSFGYRLDNYRGHFLSVIDVFEVYVDDKKIPDEHIKFCINGKEFSPIEFDKCYTEFWTIMDEAIIKVIQPGGLSEGEHKIAVTMYYRTPYCPIEGKEHDYMWTDNSGSRMMTL